MEPPIIAEIEKLEYGLFEEEHFTIYKEEVKRAMRLVAGRYGDIACHFEVRETTFAYDMRTSHKGERIEVAMPDNEIHYMVDIDTIALNHKSLTEVCHGIKCKFWGSFPDEVDNRYFKMRDFIFLVYCGQAYASHIGKIGKVAELPIEEFDIKPMLRAYKAIVELMIIEQKIVAYTYVEGKCRPIE